MKTVPLYVRDILPRRAKELNAIRCKTVGVRHPMERLVRRRARKETPVQGLLRQGMVREVLWPRHEIHRQRRRELCDAAVHRLHRLHGEALLLRRRRRRGELLRRAERAACTQALLQLLGSACASAQSEVPHAST